MPVAQLWFDVDRTPARRGQTVRLRAHAVGGTSAGRVRWQVICDPPLAWSVTGPARLARGASTDVDLRVDIPRELPSRVRTIRVELVAHLDEAELQARVETVIDLEDPSLAQCLRVVGPPKIKLNRDGTASVTTEVANCGPIDVSVELKVVRGEREPLVVERPSFTVGVGAGTVTLSTTVGRAGGTSLEVGDTVRIELATLDEVLAVAASRVTRRHVVPPGVRRVAGFVLLGALLLYAVAPDDSGPPPGPSPSPIPAATQGPEPREPSADPPVEPPAEPPIEPPAEPPIEPPAEPPAEPPIDPPAEPPAEPPIEPPAEPPIEPPAEPPIEPPAEPPIESPADPPTRPLPDLQIASLSARSTTVRNGGPGPSTDAIVSVAATVNGDPIQTAELRLAPLTAGEQVTVDFGACYPNSVVTVLADARQQVAEINENNNADEIATTGVDCLR